MNIDPLIMQDLLDSDGVRENYAKMSPEMKKWFKELLVSQGIYARFVLEKQAAKVKAAWKIGSGKGRHRH